MHKDIDYIKNIFKELDLNELKFKSENFEIELKKNNNSVISQPDIENIKTEKINEIDTEYYKVKSPIVGLFYSKSDPEEEPYVKVGSHIKKGETICIVEAMKMFNEVKSPVSGIVKKINFRDEDFISAEDVIFEIEEDND